MLRAGDFNSDGRPDLVSVGYARAVFFFGLGDGRFDPPRTVVLPGPGTQDVAVDDLNGDGLDDLVVVCRPDFYLPHGFTTLVIATPGGGFSVPPHFEAGNYPQGVAVADFDGDGDRDLAITNLEQRGFHYYGRLSLAGPIPVILRDLDGDGALDLLTAGFSGGHAAVLGGDGEGGLGAPEACATYVSFPSLAAGDFDGDGRGDLALASQNTNYTDGMVIGPATLE